MKTPDPFLELCKKYYMYHKKDPENGYFGGKMSSPSCSVLEIGFCPNMDMGVAIFGFFANI